MSDYIEFKGSNSESIIQGISDAVSTKIKAGDYIGFNGASWIVQHTSHNFIVEDGVSVAVVTKHVALRNA